MTLAVVTDKDVRCGKCMNKIAEHSGIRQLAGSTKKLWIKCKHKNKGQSACNEINEIQL
jgi:hypothetical protein